MKQYYHAVHSVRPFLYDVIAAIVGAIITLFPFYVVLKGLL